MCKCFKSPKAIEIKTKINQWGPNQIYKLLYRKEKRARRRTHTHTHTHTHPKTISEWEKIFTNNATDKGLIYIQTTQQQQKNEQPN